MKSQCIRWKGRQVGNITYGGETRTPVEGGGTMYDKSTPIMSRIRWCRLQRQLSVTQDERAGWRAEEAGLVDAMGSMDRIAVMQHEYRPYFYRYKCGLEDGQVLLRLSTLPPARMRQLDRSVMECSSDQQGKYF